MSVDAFRKPSGCVLLAAALAAALPAAAQPPVVGTTERLDTRRPEAWAQAYFGTALMPSGWSLRPRTEGWSAALEFNEVPHLDTRQRRVGFNGTKPENLNRSPVFARAWVGYALPWGIALHAGWTPPIEIDGAEATELWSLVLNRSFEHGPWRFGAAAQGGVARIEGDFTCYDEIIGVQPPGCVRPSNDQYRNSYYGAEVGIAYAPESWPLRPELTFAWHRLDAEVQVRASLETFEDRNLLTSDHSLRTFGVAVRFDLWRRFAGRLALTHTPLEVKRPDRDDVEDDDLTQLRLTVEFD